MKLNDQQDDECSSQIENNICPWVHAEEIIYNYHIYGSEYM